MHFTKRDAKIIAKPTPAPNLRVAHENAVGRIVSSAESPAHAKRPRRSIWPRNKCRRFGEVFRVLQSTKISNAAMRSIAISERTSTGITQDSLLNPYWISSVFTSLRSIVVLGVGLAAKTTPFLVIFSWRTGIVEYTEDIGDGGMSKKSVSISKRAWTSDEEGEFSWKVLLIWGSTDEGYFGVSGVDGELLVEK